MISPPPNGLASYLRKKWRLAPSPDGGAVERLARELKMPAIIARLLLTRGINDAAAANNFLEPKFRDLHPPHLLPNIDAAATRIAGAVKNREKITLYGDYDVDGITGTAMLWHTLKAGGANVDYYVPHRVEEGYGLNVEAIDALISAGTQLLVTVDCGCSAVGPITRARERGIDVVVSDHHEFAPTPPPAHSIVHPRFPGAAAAYPNPDLCGAGVAFKLAWAIAQKLCNAERVSETYRNLLLEFSGLAALGTVADVVPLTGENRVLVAHGLRQLPYSRLPGVQALIRAAGYGEGGKTLDCIAIGFALGPRLNAAGRMDHAREAVELFTTATPERAEEIATMLESQNRERQKTERKITDIAKEQVNSRRTAGGGEELILIAHHESFHAGVVGIVASRLVDLYHRPAFVLARNGDECHGSARSIPGFELHRAIEHARDLLTSGGGHAMAGGVRLHASKLDAFRQRLNAYAREFLTDDHLVPCLATDAVITLGECNAHVVSLMEKLQPFGRGNPAPRFVLEKARISAPPRRVGATGTHLQLTISQQTHVGRCIAFRMGAIEPQLPLGTELDLVVEPSINEWEGRQRVDLKVVDLSRCDGQSFEMPAESS